MCGVSANPVSAQSAANPSGPLRTVNAGTAAEATTTWRLRVQFAKVGGDMDDHFEHLVVDTRLRRLDRRQPPRRTPRQKHPQPDRQIYDRHAARREPWPVRSK